MICAGFSSGSPELIKKGAIDLKLLVLVEVNGKPPENASESPMQTMNLLVLKLPLGWEVHSSFFSHLEQATRLNIELQFQKAWMLAVLMMSAACHAGDAGADDVGSMHAVLVMLVTSDEWFKSRLRKAIGWNQAVKGTWA